MLVTFDDVHCNFGTAIRYGKDARFLDVSKLKGVDEEARGEENECEEEALREGETYGDVRG